VAGVGRSVASGKASREGASGQEVEQLVGGTLRERAGALVDRVSSTRGFTVADLERAAFFQAESVALVREAMQSQHVLELGRHTRRPPRGG